MTRMEKYLAALILGFMTALCVQLAWGDDIQIKWDDTIVCNNSGCDNVTFDIPAYDRSDWPHWIDEDGDGEKTRAEVLADEHGGCVVAADPILASAKAVWYDVYSGGCIHDASKLDVDHLVPLKEAHISGGWQWDRDKKRAYANDLSDPDHLLAVSARLNRQKGAKDPAEWRPPNVDYWCDYSRAWRRIKKTWDLKIDDREELALTIMEETCDE